MLEIIIPETELFDETNECFVSVNETKLLLEHSLVSISKWESKYHKPFFKDNKKSKEELFYYIKCMTINQPVADVIYKLLTSNDIEKINEYINDPMTATTFYNVSQKKKKKEVITSEILYYAMVSFGIPFECQKWHINRLLTLIRVCSEKNKPNEKISNRQIMERNKALNDARRKALHTKG